MSDPPTSPAGRPNIQVQQRTVSDDEGELRFDRWCKKHFPALNFGQLQKLMRSGQFRLDGKRVKGAERLEPGQIIRVPPQAVVATSKREPDRVHERDVKFIKQMVLYEDDNIIVLNKPPGLAVQGGTNTTRHIDGMLDALKTGDVRPRLVHRLDRDTSGVLVLAKSARMAKELMHAFQGHEVKKLYWALVRGRPERSSGLIDLALGKTGNPGFERMSPDALDAKQAQTDFRVILAAGKVGAWVGLMPVTGRTHQLRAHMAAINSPILGDPKYTTQHTVYGDRNAPSGLMLHAREISISMGRKIVNVTAPPSEVFLSGMRWMGLGTEPATYSKIADWDAEDLLERR